MAETVAQQEPGVADPEETPPEQSAARLAALLLSLVAGIALAFAVMPWAFRHSPTDTTRVGFLLETLSQARDDPAVVVFGNSIMMSGIDARQLGDELPGNPVSWNCASTGQTLAESFLLTQSLSEDHPRLLVYSFPLATEHGSPLPLVKWNAYYMYGFRPKPETVEILGDAYGPDITAEITRPHHVELFAARWAIRQLPDTQLRTMLRRDLNLARSERELLHPQRYQHAVAPDVFRRLLENRLAEVDGIETPIYPGVVKLARSIDAAAARQQRRLVFLVPPVHPREMELHGDRYRAAVRDFEKTFSGTRVVDASRVLVESQFIDMLHPTNEGAEVLTHFLAERIADLL